MIKLEYNPITGERVHVWERKGKGKIPLRRIVGGIGWPGKGAPGFVAVMGEELNPHRDFPELHTLHVLGEYGDWQGQNFLSVPAVFMAMGAISRVAHVHEWWGPDRPEFLRELRQHNQRQAGLRRAPLRLMRPRENMTPEWLAMRVHLRTSSQKTLYFNHADRIRAALSALGRDFSELEWTTSPEVTALLMGMAALDGRDYQGAASVRPWKPADGVAGY
jgi:hypothetical protein